MELRDRTGPAFLLHDVRLSPSDPRQGAVVHDVAFAPDSRNLPLRAACEAVLRKLGFDHVERGWTITLADNAADVTSAAAAEERARVSGEVHQLTREITHLVDAVAQGGDVPELAQGLRTRRDRRAALTDALGALTQRRQVVTVTSERGVATFTWPETLPVITDTDLASVPHAGARGEVQMTTHGGR